jgi:hypothetical protein
MYSMGLFSKLRANVNHGGVKIQIQAPDSVTANQVIPVTLTVTADSVQTVNSATVVLEAQTHEQGFGLERGGMGVNEQETAYQTVAQIQNHEVFTIQPDETKTVTLELSVNGNVGTGQLGQFGTAAGGILQAVVSVAQRMDNVSYTYRLHASLDIQGVGMGPHADQSIQIIPAPSAQPVVQQQSQQPIGPQSNGVSPQPVRPGTPPRGLIQ